MRASRLGLRRRAALRIEIFVNDVALGMRASKYDSGDAISRTVFKFLQGVSVGPTLKGATAFLNFDSGWAAAARAVEMLMARVGESPRRQDRHRPHPRGRWKDLWRDARGRLWVLDRLHVSRA